MQESIMSFIYVSIKTMLVCNECQNRLPIYIFRVSVIEMSIRTIHHLFVIDLKISLSIIYLFKTKSLGIYAKYIKKIDRKVSGLYKNAFVYLITARECSC